MNKISVELFDSEALALAQFLKRIGWSEIRVNAVDETEAWEVRDALARLRESVNEAGFNPR